MLVKADGRIHKYYDDNLVPDNLKYIGDEIREELTVTEKSLLLITGEEFLLQTNPVVLRAVKLRIPFISPLHFLQVDFLAQLRNTNENDILNPIITDILMITIQGIAAGMQNTG